MSAMNSASNPLASSVKETPASAARLMILSSMSVMFIVSTTSYPK
jgi:hypothetical protein